MADSPAAVAAATAGSSDYPLFASTDGRFVPATATSFPAKGVPRAHAEDFIEQYHLLDYKPRLNTSSYVNVEFDGHEKRLMECASRVNIADQTIYPGSWALHNDTLSMVARLWNAPEDAFDAVNSFPGAQTVGSTEACLLAGLALKMRWRSWYSKRYGVDKSTTRGILPNIVISSCYQAAWEKFTRYMDVDLKIVRPQFDKNGFRISSDDVAEACDERTIGVVAIFGNHYSGDFDPVGEISRRLEQLNTEMDWQIAIHVDAASGGFVAPFLPEGSVEAWDFRLPNVVSISASGHKFGLASCGTGWIVWRRRHDLAEHIATSVTYLGGCGESYTLNFSRPATGSYIQMYKFATLGMEGYSRAIENQMQVASMIRKKLSEMRGEDSVTPRFLILDSAYDTSECCLPVVCAMLNPELDLPYNDQDLQHVVAERHWYVSAYQLSFVHPSTDDVQALLDNGPTQDQTCFRIVVKCSLTAHLATDLIDTIRETVSFLDVAGAGYAKMHRVKPGHVRRVWTKPNEHAAC